jgi:GNAT superfamily N-acetyltransferase
MTFDIIEANLDSPTHRRAMVQLLDQYARDPMGGGKALADEVKMNLPNELAKRSSAHSILAFIDAEAAGLLICFEGFSTFACKPILNIHDIFVSLPYRGHGVSKLLLQKAEAIAIALGCCKLTLEVLQGNHIAQSAYKAFGFSGYELDPRIGKALFWEKKL